MFHHGRITSASQLMDKEKRPKYGFMEAPMEFDVFAFMYGEMMCSLGDKRELVIT